jgi:peptidoglycan LD-endopeptidase CwlK
MAITLGSRSLARLEGVHPDLVRVVKRAAALATASLDFTVLEGVRSREQMMVNYGKGRNVAQLAAKGIPAKYAKPGERKVTWLNNPFNSNHRVMEDGFGHAVDLAPWPIDWEDSKRFEQLAELMFEAAQIEKVRVRWGRDWDEDGRYEEKGETDGPHFELVRK